MDWKSEINMLIEKLAFVENKELRQIMLDGFIKKHGEIPDEYTTTDYVRWIHQETWRDS